MDEGRSVIDRTRTATEQHAAEIAQLNELLQAGAIDQATYARAVEDANDRALRSSQAWTDGATRFLKDYVAESNDAASATERAFANAFSGAEDALVGFIATGKLEFQGLADTILADLARTTVRQTITAPLARTARRTFVRGRDSRGALQSAFAGGGLFGLFHSGGAAVRYALRGCRGVRARAALPRRRVCGLRPPAGRGPDHRPAWRAGGAARAGRA
jgi:lambda family phage tail tape measure protein